MVIAFIELLSPLPFLEPIITEGAPDIQILQDGWTAVSQDQSRSAQFEHTVLITSNGCEILTQ